MNKKILIVDDNTDLNKVLQISLNESYDTISAINGEDAVDLAVTEVPDLIIMDLVEYEVDSLEAIPLIRQNPKTCSIPIIAITAGLHDTIEHGDVSIDFDDYIAMPFLDEDLFPSIEKLLKPDSV